MHPDQLSFVTTALLKLLLSSDQRCKRAPKRGTATLGKQHRRCIDQHGLNLL